MRSRTRRVTDISCKLELARPMFKCSYLESKTEPSVVKAINYTAHILLVEKHILGGWETAHTLLMRGTTEVGTPHSIETKYKF